ncbi:sulfate permease [Basidiobolus meristosporus CBS 931.73]|uniref:Sulfate permease n=1 Tax=Basidiobolus meristosporus CBS 931.73 TaxID=1314790 RepID=A0A1Y1XRP6_9FUNG|nr:sulfate permease [Basidiobolus meristosporus CBS 931.73]|eukprot:ORX88403.1 sulfate permease [Basidiobolus meristosporus CBS 931.73]
MSSVYIDDPQISFKDQVRNYTKQAPTYAAGYVRSLLPIVDWIGHYNMTWFIGDLIAGITVGAVVVPQGMAYSKLATLPPQYGLYSSFVGVIVYCFFATSKDITIGPVAVMSQLLAQIIGTILDKGTTYTNVQIAVCLCLLSGCISFALGLLRLGFIVDFIPHPAIAGYMTGSAISIAIGQLTKLLGIAGVNTRDPSYLVLGNSLGGLGRTKLDAVFGFTGLIWLYGIRWGVGYFSKKYPRLERPLFFFGISRNAILIIFATLISFLINIGKTTSPISILKNVPSGFREVRVPVMDSELISQVASSLPVVTLVLIMEHVAIAKSFGRVNDYKIDPNQEVIAIGFTNMIASFFSAYPATGSFSRTAIKAKSGVRTPIAGVYAGIIVLLALYALTPAFYYIPDATLAAVIIHAVGDLISGPKAIKELWRVSFIEFFIFAIGVIVTFFTNIEDGIYTTVGLSLAVLLFRIARPRYNALGRLSVVSKTIDGKPTERYAYVPIDNPNVVGSVFSPPEGVLVFRLEESVTYPNAGYVSDRIVEYVKDNSKRGKPLPKSFGDRPWNDASGKVSEHSENFPVCRALVVDLAGVNQVDTTGAQALLDARSAIDRYADRKVEWHFANVNAPTIRRKLVAAGFGNEDLLSPSHGPQSPVAHATHTTTEQPEANRDDLESAIAVEKAEELEEKFIAKTGTEISHKANDEWSQQRYPFFHYDLEDAVRAASRLSN